MSTDGLAARLLATFVAELDEQLAAMNAELIELERDPANPEPLRGLFRIAHTLKGAARAAGVPAVESTCHALESLLARARERNLQLGPEQFALLFATADGLSQAGARVRAGGGPEAPDAELKRLTQALSSAALTGRTPPAARRPSAAAAAPESPSAKSPSAATPKAASAAPQAPAAAPAESRATPPAPAAEPREEQVRVEAGKLDSLVAATGQLLVGTGRLRGRPARMQQLEDAAARCGAELRRLRRRLRSELAEGPAAVSLLRSVEQLDERLSLLTRQAGELTVEVREDARLLTRAGEGVGTRVYELRMRPFADACAVLPRAIRDLAAAADKSVRLEVVGGEVEADRAVLDVLRDVILHLVRNAVDHGIEAPAERERRGKPPEGVVRVSAALEGGRLRVTVSDDGAGLDLRAIRARLAREGVRVPADEEELAAHLFDAGFSTREEATAISGRGVGLDIARTAVHRIRGSIGVRWTEGAGTTFTVECPPTLTTVRVLLLTVGPVLLAVPTAQVERLVRVAPDQLLRAEGRDFLRTDAAPVPVVALARLLGPPLVERPLDGPTPVVLLQSGDQRLAVTVDSLVAEQEVIARPLERVRLSRPLLSGATVLGNGRVALILNPGPVIEAGLGEGAHGLARSEGSGAERERASILVVDDSITTRTLEQSILEASGYRVVTATDGAEAWRLLQESPVDLVVSDVEMPRMSGFELCASIRASQRLRDLPVILVTALESDADRARGLEAGANAYVTKSSFDQRELLESIRQLLG